MEEHQCQELCSLHPSSPGLPPPGERRRANAASGPQIARGFVSRWRRRIRGATNLVERTLRPVPLPWRRWLRLFRRAQMTPDGGSSDAASSSDSMCSSRGGRRAARHGSRLLERLAWAGQLDGPVLGKSSLRAAIVNASLPPELV
ncbi:hypothetical protein U9M48_011683 [Paspalum notatum var. saurae]|uniref:Uncharacterized protein n=1 Tax=Paspalum notatum var. saurae TaxID=547442 RepID=A0AAQ3SVY5_PASNO